MPDSTPIKGNGKTHTDFNGLYISSLGLLCYFPLLSNPWIWLHIFLSLCITEFYPYSLALFSFGCYCGSNFLFVCLFKKLFIYFYFKKKKERNKLSAHLGPHDPSHWIHSVIDWPWLKMALGEPAAYSAFSSKIHRDDRDFPKPWAFPLLSYSLPLFPA